MMHLRRSLTRHADYRGPRCALPFPAHHHAKPVSVTPSAQRSGRTILEFLRL
jgi:hypothetical protein